MVKYECMGLSKNIQNNASEVITVRQNECKKRGEYEM